ncbi:hypothetical protein NDU88_006313 [Pleurodeles waltl]|uniref:Uncharacterized protein n=1 Tax=Pleurodeles waltl TaxID=8319 RepID=A0AAV7NPW6_PLEWA|nr:hypothetical protein NDU88_006313 [Pleurodeles waltl]
MVLDGWGGSGRGPNWELRLGADERAVQQLAEAHETHTKTLERLRCHDYKTYLGSLHAQGGRAGRLLARLVRPESSGTPITQLTSQTGTPLYSPTDINEEFQSYYTSLYGTTGEVVPDSLRTYLERMQLVTVSEWDKKEVGARMDEQEV